MSTESSANTRSNVRALYDFEADDARQVVGQKNRAERCAENVRSSVGMPKSRHSHTYRGLVQATRLVRDSHSRVSTSLVLFWWRALLQFALKRGFSKLLRDDPAAYRAFARWVAGERVWRACMNAVIVEKEDSVHPSRVTHPELVFMRQFEDKQGLASLAESRVMRIEESETRASSLRGAKGFVRFASRNANAMCDLDSEEICSILNQLQSEINRECLESLVEEQTKQPRRRRASSRGCLGCILSLLFSCACCSARPNTAEPRRLRSVELGRPRRRSAVAVMEYVHSVCHLGMPKSASVYKNLYF